MTRMTRKRAEALVEKKWGNVSNVDYQKEVYSLCYDMPDLLSGDWNEYWYDINIYGCRTIQWYDDWFFANPKPSDFLRLLTVHLFIRHTYKD